ncbi:hypothetical protein TrLO_g10981 [Triparma laevis f. longispina]|uniref:Uncharacterized protein n=1 Tax=Triparma laevis f. longispina TaxID=1714387 RepID=A0A9W6ZNV6_9STRA|nr:hypothetical protein TrLO_g10981 [Triparma laevis f. longispina]
MSKSFVPGDTLMRLRLATQGWKAVADAFMDEGVRSGAMIVHGGEDTSWNFPSDSREKRHKLATRVIFLLNIRKVGEHACACAINLVVVDIPEGVLVPSNINSYDSNGVITYLRSKQNQL